VIATSSIPSLEAYCGLTYTYSDASPVTMTTDLVSVPIHFQKHGIKPPVFIAGSFSEPAWEPQEMETSAGDGGEVLFKKTVTAVKGTPILYKFRIGEADDWILDERTPTGKRITPLTFRLSC
jgi:hypothetical protein